MTHRSTTQFKTAKTPCKRCGSFQRYERNSVCPCHAAARNAKYKLHRTYAAENQWLADWLKVRKDRASCLVHETGIHQSTVSALQLGKRQILPHVRLDLLKGMAAVEAAEGGAV